jgi:hypothetical protein
MLEKFAFFAARRSAQQPRQASPPADRPAWLGRHLSRSFSRASSQWGCVADLSHYLPWTRSRARMNLEKFTERARGFLQSAQTVATRMNHQRIAPAHVLKALLEDEH